MRICCAEALIGFLGARPPNTISQYHPRHGNRYELAYFAIRSCSCLDVIVALAIEQVKELACVAVPWHPCSRCRSLRMFDLGHVAYNWSKC